MSSRTKVGVVGISGDPPTLGHIWLAQTAEEIGEFDLVWLMPCYGHRYGKQMVSPDHRMAMTRIAAREAGGAIVASSYEIDRRSDGSCYFTTCMMRDDYPDWDITWVIGMDNALSIDKWQFADILKAGGLTNFLVCTRPGVATPPGPHWFEKSPHRFATGTGNVQCSSTDFRRLYRLGDAGYRDMVSPGVLDYIQKAGLYRGDEP